jgi:hypothetical protein
MQTDDQLLARAEHSADAKMKFYTTAAFYLCLICFLVALDWWTTGRITWSVWPMFGLGFALASQGVKAWFRTGTLRDQMVARELEALRRQQKQG